MESIKEMLIARGEQAIVDRKVLEDAQLHEVEQMPMWYTFEALRFLQRYCNKKNLAIHDVSPQMIIDCLK